MVIIGASLAGVRTAESLRADGYQGEITLVGDEEEVPYDRPPLSKQVLRGEWEPDRIRLRPLEELSEKLRINLVLGKRAEHMRVENQQLILHDATVVSFDAAVLATGARARVLASSAAHKSAHTVRTLADSLRLRSCLIAGARVVVIGAGFIGAEVAAAAKSLGCEVLILEAANTPLERQLGAEMGVACGALHERNGVELRCSVTVDHFTADTVVLADGTSIPADVVVVGVGAQPNTEWLESSGLQISDGVLCDEFCRVIRVDGSSVSNIVAAGDIARFPNTRYEATDGSSGPLMMRIEHWTNAADMAMSASQTLVGQRVAYQPVPYFWSDQYSHKIQFFGRADGFDEVRVVDGNPADGAWLALYRRDERIVAALGVSKIRALMPYRKLLQENATWDSALESAGVR